MQYARLFWAGTSVQFFWLKCYMFVVPKIDLMDPKTILFFIFIISISCSSNDCDFVNTTEPYQHSGEFQTNPIEGTYKLSPMSTDNSFDSRELSNARLHFVSDPTSDGLNGLNGQFLFTNYPGWDNATSQNKLEDFYGSWTIATQPGGIFRDGRLSIAPFYADFDNASAKTMVGNLDVRLRVGQPIIVVRVLKDLNMADAKFGYSLVYPTSQSKNYCNYLVFEKVSAAVNDSTKTQIVSTLNVIGK